MFVRKLNQNLNKRLIEKTYKKNELCLYEGRVVNKKFYHTHSYKRIESKMMMTMMMKEKRRTIILLFINIAKDFLLHSFIFSFNSCRRTFYLCTVSCNAHHQCLCQVFHFTGSNFLHIILLWSVCVKEIHICLKKCCATDVYVTLNIKC